MKFGDFICFEATLTQARAVDRDEVIRALVASLEQAGRLPEGKARDLAEAVIARENEASTGMGKGVAVPHVKHEAITEIVGAVGVYPDGVDFAALDKQPVFSVLLVLSPAGNPDQHLRAMEGIFRHLQEEKFRRFLRQCTTAEQVKDLLLEADENPSW